MRKAYLSVEEPPDAIPLVSIFFPAQDTGEHEGKKDKVGDKGGNDADLGVLRIQNSTNTFDPGSAEYGYACQHFSGDEMLGKSRDRRTVCVGDNVGEPGSRGNCDDDLVLLPECRAESTKLKGGKNKAS
jgi:hypothetical protein